MAADKYLRSKLGANPQLAQHYINAANNENELPELQVRLRRMVRAITPLTVSVARLVDRDQLVVHPRHDLIPIPEGTTTVVFIANSSSRDVLDIIPYADGGWSFETPVTVAGAQTGPCVPIKEGLAIVQLVEHFLDADGKALDRVDRDVFVVVYSE